VHNGVQLPACLSKNRGGRGLDRGWVVDVEPLKGDLPGDIGLL